MYSNMSKDSIIYIYHKKLNKADETSFADIRYINLLIICIT